MAGDFGNSARAEPLHGGYRLLRRLAVGSRASILLGLEPHSSVPVALKLFHAETTEESIDRELGALTIYSGAHMVELLDVQRAEGAPTVLAFERLRPIFGPGLDGLAAGQSSTLLVPITRTIARLHAAGLAHTALRPTAIGLDGGGRPMITGWGHAIRRDRSDFDAACGADRRTLSALAHLSARMTTEPAERAALGEFADMLERAATAERLDDLAEELITRIPPRPLGEAPATPQRLLAPAPAAAPPVDSLRAGPRTVVAAAPEAPAGVTASGVIRRWRVLGRWSRGQDAMATWGQLIARVSRRTWVTFGVATAAILLVTILWPSDAGAPETTATVSTGSAAPTQAALSDEPAEAVLQLLERRSQCFRDQSLLCLESADDLSSALFLDDQRRLAGQAATAPPSDFEAPWDSAILVEREGDAALVDLHRDGSESTASALLIHQSAGWRLRALLPTTPVQ